MKFTIIWLPSAEDDLAKIWTAAGDRNTIGQAALEIDRLIAATPLDAGESRAGNERIVFAPPLTALIEVRQADRLVNVLHVRRLPTHS